MVFYIQTLGACINYYLGMGEPAVGPNGEAVLVQD